MATRVITGLIKRSNGDPWAGGVVRFRLLDDTFTLSPDETFPIYEVVAVANDSGVMTATLASGLSQPYKVTLPDGEWFYIAVPAGSATTLEILRAAFGGVPIAAGNLVGPTGPAGSLGPTGPQGVQGNTGSTGPAGSGTVIVQEGDVTVDAAATTLDFDASDFNITSSPAGEANITLAYGTIAGTPAEGNHSHAITVTTRSGTAQNITAGSSNTATADCIGGEVAIAGGCVGSTSLVWIYRSERATSTQWLCGGHNDDAVTRTIQAHVICLESPVA